MSIEVEAQELALVVLHQYLVRKAHMMTIARESLQAIWPVERWHDARITAIETALARYFPTVKRRWYRGRLGEPGFNGFVVSGLRSTKSRKRPARPIDFELITPSRHNARRSWGLHLEVPGIEWGSFEGRPLLDYNLLLMRCYPLACTTMREESEA